MSTLSQQASAVETARRIVVGGVKLPGPNSAQRKLLAEHLLDAANTLREVAERKP